MKDWFSMLNISWIDNFQTPHILHVILAVNIILVVLVWQIYRQHQEQQAPNCRPKKKDADSRTKAATPHGSSKEKEEAALPNIDNVMKKGKCDYGGETEFSHTETGEMDRKRRKMADSKREKAQGPTCQESSSENRETVTDGAETMPSSGSTTNIYCHEFHSENFYVNAPLLSDNTQINSTSMMAVGEKGNLPKVSKVKKCVAESSSGTSPDAGSSETPPPYDSVMGEEQKKPFMVLELEDKTYKLETATPEEAEEDVSEDIPDDLYDLVSEICAEENVTSAMLYPSLSKKKELLVVGVGASKEVEEKLQSAVKKSFPDFTIVTDCIKSYLDHTRIYAKKAFTAVKELLREDKTYCEVSSATCELILEGRDPSYDVSRLYAFVSAHFVLEEPEQQVLKDAEAAEGATKHVQETTAGKTVNHRYGLTLLTPKKCLPVCAQDAIYSYRPYQRGKAMEGSSHFSCYYGDAYLLKVDEQYWKTPDARIITKEELHSGMQTRIDDKEIGDILPIFAGRDLSAMSTKKVKIEVGPSSGYMIIPGRSLRAKEESDSRPQLLHIQFVILDWNIFEGHSGSIVYVVDAVTNKRHRLGVLFGECRRQKDRRVFQAIVLCQAIKELETEYKHKVKDLTPMGKVRRVVSKEEAFAVRKRLVRHKESECVNGPRDEPHPNNITGMTEHVARDSTGMTEHVPRGTTDMPERVPTGSVGMPEHILRNGTGTPEHVPKNRTSPPKLKFSLQPDMNSTAELEQDSSSLELDEDLFAATPSLNFTSLGRDADATLGAGASPGNKITATEFNITEGLYKNESGLQHTFESGYHTGADNC